MSAPLDEASLYLDGPLRAHWLRSSPSPGVEAASRRAEACADFNSGRRHAFYDGNEMLPVVGGELDGECLDPSGGAACDGPGWVSAFRTAQQTVYRLAYIAVEVDDGDS